MTFDEWIMNVFDHPVTEPEWYWDLEASFWEGPPTTVVFYLTRLFTEAGTVLGPYSEAQVAQGLHAVISNAITDYPYLLRDMSVPLAARLDCIGAMETLFQRYFALRCSPHLSHLGTKVTPADVSPLNVVCYTWWETLPLHGLSRTDLVDGPALDSAVFSVIRHCLGIESIACQESALLGLMEWSIYYDETREIADHFLRKGSAIQVELRAFARRVAQGTR